MHGLYSIPVNQDGRSPIYLHLRSAHYKLDSRICRQIQDLHTTFGIKDIKEEHRSLQTLLSFYHKGVEIEFIFALWAAVSKIQSDFFAHSFKSRGSKLSLFWSTCRFSKLPSSCKKPGIWKFSRNYICALFLSQNVETGPISFYGQRFPRHRPIFQIAIFGHEIWSLAKAHILPSPPGGGGGRSWAYFPSTGSGLRDTGWVSNLSYLSDLVKVSLCTKRWNWA